jgi:hypothetical protein
MFALSAGVGERRLGRSESPLNLAWAPLSSRAGAVSSPNAACINAILPWVIKSVSLRRKKRYTTEGPPDGTRLLATRYFPCGLIFHFGWEQRRIGPFVCGFVPANE